MSHGVGRRWRRVAWALALTLPLALTWGGQLYDVLLYHAWARRLGAGELPYRDFVVEYPPLALAFVVAPGLWTRSLGGFAAAFFVQAALVAAAQKLLLARVTHRPWHLLAVLGALEACLYATYLKRFDVFAAALTSWALARLVRAPGRPGGWVLLGLGAAVKLYPALLVPLAAAYAGPRVGRGRAWGLLPAVAAAAFVVPTALAYFVCGPGATSWLGYHAARGLHLPSSYTAAWLALGNFGTPLAYGLDFGAMQVFAPWADVWARRSGLVLLLALAATYLAVLPRLRTPTALWRAATAVVAALLLTSKVLSPQFIAWLLPLVTVSALGARALDAGGAIDAVGLTGAGFRRVRLPPIDVPLLVLVFAVAITTAELFPSETQLALPYTWRRLALVARTLALAALWARAAGAPALDSPPFSPRWHTSVLFARRQPLLGRERA